MEKIIWSFKTLADAEKMGAITALRDTWRPLSNFWYTPVTMFGVSFPTNEHAFTAAKDAQAGTPAGMASLHAFAALRTPSDAKKKGRQITLRADWEQPYKDGLLFKEWVLLTLLRRKFETPKMRDLLLSSEDRLILEGNTWGDRVWGVIDTKSGVEGYNRLGAMLMSVREELGGHGVPTTLDIPNDMPRYTGKGL